MGDNVTSVTSKIKKALKNLAIEVIPQQDGSILIVSNIKSELQENIKSELQKAAEIICNFGYMFSYQPKCNFFRLTDYTIYPDELVSNKPNLDELTLELLKQTTTKFNVVIAQQENNVYAVIGPTSKEVMAAEAAVRHLGFNVTNCPGTYFLVHLFNVTNNSSEEKTA